MSALKHRMRASQGQGIVEFALISTLVVILLLVSVQGAIIANASLAVTQLAYEGSRYAAVNPGYTIAAITNYIMTVASPAIAENNGADISVTISPNVTPRTFGTPISVSIVYNAKSKIVLPTPLFGLKFPSSLTSMQTAMSE